MMKGQKITLVAALAVVLMVASANASPLMSDDFNSYTQGNLVPQDSWVAHSGTVGPVQVVDSLCAVQGVVAGNGIELVNGSATEDVSKPIGSIMEAGDKWYAGFCVRIDAESMMTDFGDYFAHFKNASTGFVAKVGIQMPVDGISDYNIYLWQGSGDGSADGIAWGSDFLYGSCHRIVTSYDYDTGDVEMWIDPDCAAGPTGNPSVTLTGVYPGTAVEAYAFRQTNYYDPDPVMNIDNLNVGTEWIDACAVCVPEPATLALLALGGLAVLRRR